MATSDFGKAFAAARKAGKKEFSFGGKAYHTRTKEEDAAQKSGASKPAVKADLSPARATGQRKSGLAPAATTAKRKTPMSAPTVGSRGSAALRAGTLPGRAKAPATAPKPMPSKPEAKFNTVGERGQAALRAGTLPGRAPKTAAGAGTNTPTHTDSRDRKVAKRPAILLNRGASSAGAGPYPRGPGAASRRKG